MAGFGWIHTRFPSFDLVLWHRFQQRNFMSTKTEKQKTQSKHVISPKNIWYEDSPGNNINQSKPGVCAVLFILWCSCFVFVFSFCILGFKLFVFLFAMLLHFSWFNPLFFQNAAGFKTLFHYKEHQNKFLIVYNLWIKQNQIKNVWQEGGTGPPLLRIHF